MPTGVVRRSKYESFEHPSVTSLRTPPPVSSRQEHFRSATKCLIFGIFLSISSVATPSFVDELFLKLGADFSVSTVSQSFSVFFFSLSAFGYVRSFLSRGADASTAALKSPQHRSLLGLAASANPLTKMTAPSLRAISTIPVSGTPTNTEPRKDRSRASSDRRRPPMAPVSDHAAGTGLVSTYQSPPPLKLNQSFASPASTDKRSTVSLFGSSIKTRGPLSVGTVSPSWSELDKDEKLLADYKAEIQQEKAGVSPGVTLHSPYAPSAPKTPSQPGSGTTRSDSFFGTPWSAQRGGAMSPASHVGTGQNTAKTPYRLSVSPRQSPSHPTRVQDELGYANTAEAERRLQELGIQVSMKQWTENIRMWFAETLVIPLAQKIAENIHTMKELGMDPFDLHSRTGPTPPKQQTASMFGAFGAAGQSVHANSPFPGGPSKMNDAVMTNCKLAPYVMIPLFHASKEMKEYVSNRITELASAYIKDYKWNSGGIRKGNGGSLKEWSPDLPSDSLILYNVFCTFFDYTIQAAADTGQRPFTQNFSLCKPEKKSKIRERVALYQLQQHPPHFEVVVDQHTFAIEQGKDNLFQAIAVFFYHIKNVYDGHLSTLNLHERPLDLMSLVKPRPPPFH